MNKIRIQSSVTVSPSNIATLCFVDGLFIPKSKYALENHELTLYKESEDYISLFYIPDGRTYNYELYLNEMGIKIQGKDITRNTLSGANDDNVMIFVDGKILRKDQYRVENSGTIQLLVEMPWLKRMCQVTVYVDSKSISHNYIYAEPGQSTKLSYNINNSFVFINGKLVPSNKIRTIIEKGQESFFVDVPYTLPNTDKGIVGDDIEIYTLPRKHEDSKPFSLNFTGEKGYLNYGPIDDNHTEIPLYYDTIVTFSDNVNVLIDNARAGLYLKEDGESGELIFVDDNYQTKNIKAITTQGFVRTNLTESQYYLESPSYKSITDYLSEYDKSKQLLPEILNVFQRFLIDEFRDSIDRLNNIRNLSKVDAANMGRLIRLLGCNLDIKRLNIKQRRELLSELNEYYRMVGTHDSYNFFNIFQDSTRIIRVEQLFTPLDNGSKENDHFVYTYKYGISNAGYGYKVGERYLIEGTNLTVQVRETETRKVDGQDRPGIITKVSYSVFEGENKYNIDKNLIPMAGGAEISVTSTAIYWDYDITVHANNANYLKGEKLYNENYKVGNKLGEIVLTGDNLNGDLKSGFTASIKNGNKYLDLKNLPLNTKNNNDAIETTKISINSKSSSIKTTNLVKETPSTTTESLTLNPGVYRIELIGGGGAGGASITGYNNQVRSGGAGATSIPTVSEIIITQPTTMTYYVGAGGKTKKNGGNGGAPGDGGNSHEVGGAGGGGGNPTYVTFDTSVSLLKGGTASKYLISQGGGGGGGAGGDGRYGRWGGGGSGGGGGGYYHMDATTGKITPYDGKKGGYAIGSDDQPGGAGAKGNSDLFSNIISGKGGRGGYSGSLRDGAGAGATGGGAGGGGGRAGAGNHGSSYGGGGGGGAGGSTRAGGGAAGHGKENGTAGYNHRVKAEPQKDYYTGITVKYGEGGIPDENGQDGFIRVRQITQSYSGKLSWDEKSEILYDIGDTITTSDKKFTATIISLGKNSADIMLSPLTGDVYEKRNESIVSNVAITVKSIPKKYSYTHHLDGSQSYYAPGMILHTTVKYPERDKKEQIIDPNAALLSQDFTITILETDKNSKITKSIMSPNQGDINITTLQNFATEAESGTLGRISVTSTENNQKNNARTYVDFYKKDEYPGTPAVLERQYISNKIDYGLVTVGTDASPYPWSPTDADEDYGDSRYLNAATNADTNLVTYEDYGFVTEDVGGYWDEYWSWDRPRSAYATNHVEVEVNILAGENYDEVIERFYQQFYNLASTVLYIHRLVTVFNFGQSGSSNTTTDGTVQDFSFGIMTSPYAAYEKYYYASDPLEGKVIS